jgi:hypothetical protein
MTVRLATGEAFILPRMCCGAAFSYTVPPSPSISTRSAVGAERLDPRISGLMEGRRVAPPLVGSQLLLRQIPSLCDSRHI